LITLGLRHDAIRIIQKQRATITNRALERDLLECRFGVKRVPWFAIFPRESNGHPLQNAPWSRDNPA
jgi:hypothetical protein